ncbi:luciferin sulfotransferase-like [Zophobas morio]|uniref:luciferin sulfotransferase-like n=1 Tax=Zophobas morio TaxID=2755281 RepID=UPI003082B52B
MDFEKLLQEKYTNVFRKGYSTAKGFTVTKRYDELKEDLDNLQVSENDIWICSFPKCGTTWTQEMVWMIINNLDFERAKRPLDERSPFVEFSMLYDDRELFDKKPDYKPALYLHDSIGHYKSLKSPLLVKSHLPIDLLPKQLREGSKKPKIVYVARDPRDVCISYYHHSKLIEGFKGTCEEFCELFLAGKVPYAPYWQHVLPFWEKRNNLNVLYLKYEDMKKDLPSIVRQVAAFVGRSLTNEQVQILANHLSFESMSKNKAVNKEEHIENKRRNNLTDYQEGKFMRSGKVGDYKTSMTPEICVKFENWIKNNIENTDYVI